MSRPKHPDATAVFAAFCRWTARHPDGGLAELRLFDDGSGNVFDRRQELAFQSLAEAVERLDADALPARRTSSLASPPSLDARQSELDALVCRRCGAPMCSCESCDGITRRDWLARQAEAPPSEAPTDG